jgi:hypothetical protein
MPRTVNLITGPSRTGDIEQTIELGAHGPRRLHIILDASAASGATGFGSGWGNPGPDGCKAHGLQETLKRVPAEPQFLTTRKGVERARPLPEQNAGAGACAPE